MRMDCAGMDIVEAACIRCLLNPCEVVEWARSVAGLVHSALRHPGLRRTPRPGGGGPGAGLPADPPGEPTAGRSARVGGEPGPRGVQGLPRVVRRRRGRRVRVASDAGAADAVGGSVRGEDRRARAGGSG